MNDSTIYKPGETIAASLTLEPGHAIPRRISDDLRLQLEPGAPFAPLARVDTVTLKSPMAPPSEPTASGATEVLPPLTFALAGVVPRYIVGGTYKPTRVMFFMPDGGDHHIDMVVPNGDFSRYIADDPPTAYDVPVIVDFS